MIFILCLALIMLCFINQTRIVAALFSLMSLAVGALFFLQTFDREHQVGIAVSFGLWLIVSFSMFRNNTKVDRLRILKG